MSATYAASGLRQGWHVTYEGFLDSIAEHGIDNTRCPVAVWANDDGWDDGAYVWDTLRAAEDYARLLGPHPVAGNPVIVVVDLTGLDPVPDGTGARKVEGAWFVRAVPADRMSVTATPGGTR